MLCSKNRETLVKHYDTTVERSGVVSVLGDGRTFCALMFFVLRRNNNEKAFVGDEYVVVVCYFCSNFFDLRIYYHKQ